MSATFVGSFDLATALPGGASAAAAGAAGIDAALPELNARLTALADQITELTVNMPAMPDFQDMADRAAYLVTQIALAMATPGLPPPPTFQTAIDAMVALVTQLEATAAAIQANVDVIVAFQALLAAGGVYAIAYDGDLSSLGSSVQSVVTSQVGSSGHCNALVLVTKLSATWTAMSQVFKVTP